MATEFTASVKSSAGDYTTLNAALSGLACDLTSAATKVFSISSVIGTGPAAGDSLLGLTSAATGTCVLVNAAATQILIKSITGTFQSGETVKKLTDVTKEVVLSNAGDSPIAGVQCFAFSDTTAVSWPAFTTGASNYVRIYAAAGAEAQIPYNTTTSYRLQVATPGSSGALAIGYGATLYVRVERIQVQSARATGFAEGDNGLTVSADNTGNSDVRIVQCYVQGIKSGAGSSNTTACEGIHTQTGNTNGTVKVINCIVEGYDDTGGANNIGFKSRDNIANTWYNCLAYNCAIGFVSGGTNTLVKNSQYDRGATTSHVGFSGTFNASTDFCASTESDTTGTHSRNAQTFTYVNTGTKDYHLASGDTGAKTFGTDLSADATYAFSTDFDSISRSVPWDIGPTKAPGGGGAATVTWTGVFHGLLMTNIGK